MKGFIREYWGAWEIKANEPCLAFASDRDNMLREAEMRDNINKHINDLIIAHEEYSCKIIKEIERLEEIVQKEDKFHRMLLKKRDKERWEMVHE